MGHPDGRRPRPRARTSTHARTRTRTHTRTHAHRRAHATAHTHTHTPQHANANARTHTQTHANAPRTRSPLLLLPPGAAPMRCDPGAVSTRCNARPRCQRYLLIATVTGPGGSVLAMRRGDRLQLPCACVLGNKKNRSHFGSRPFGQRSQRSEGVGSIGRPSRGHLACMVSYRLARVPW